MEALEVTVSASSRVVWRVVAYSDSEPAPGLTHDWELFSPSLRGAQKRVTASLTETGWLAVGRWADGRRTFVRS